MIEQGTNHPTDPKPACTPATAPPVHPTHLHLVTDITEHPAPPNLCSHLGFFSKMSRADILNDRGPPSTRPSSKPNSYGATTFTPTTAPRAPAPPLTPPSTPPPKGRTPLLLTTDSPDRKRCKLPPPGHRALLLILPLLRTTLSVLRLRNVYGPGSQPDRAAGIL